MPNRIIREGWIESEKINQLDALAERFYLRLCLRADDFGRYHANPLLLRSALFPLREDVKNADIPRWLSACEKSGLLRCYSDSEGKNYVEIVKFQQRTRAEKSKFPTPPTDDGQMTVKCLTDDRQPRTYSETETETKSDSIGAPAKPSRVNVLFEALAIAEGSDPRQLTKSAGARIGTALAEIRAAMPDVTVTEIRDRAKAYRKLYPTAACTANALAAHWAKLSGVRVSFEQSKPIDGPANWRETLARLYPDASRDVSWATLPESIKEQIAKAS